MPAVVVLLAALAALAQAVRLDRAGAHDTSPADAAAAPSSTANATPVLSVRRVPRWLGQPAADTQLVAALNGIVAQSPPDSCLVVREGGRTLVAHRPDVALVPASNLKLLTATAVLASLGPDTTLRTTVAAAAPAAGGVVNGDLYLIGGGDPLLATADYIARFEEPVPHDDLAKLADAVVNAGITEIRGAIVGDDGRYDAKRTVATWKSSYVTDNEVGPLSALLVNDGFAKFPPKSSLSVGVVATNDPPAHAATQLRALLAQRGISSTGARAGAAPAARTELAGVDSMPVRTMVAEMLSQSDNTTAELLTKELGARATKGAGTTSDGVAAIRATLDKQGIAGLDKVVLADGSGLDTGNRVTCQVLADVLDRAGPGSALADGLAVAGQKGTLRTRFVGTPAVGRLAAKTGSLRDARALAGFVATTDGRTLTFAYVSNRANIFGDNAYTKLQETLGVELAAYPLGPTVAQLSPLPAS